MVELVPERKIPGAPPPAPLSKSQKKKRKTGKVKAGESPVIEPVSIPDSTSAALVDKAPQPADVKEGSVAEELVTQPESVSGATPADAPASQTATASPVVEIIQKRLKATTKKILRIQTYASTDPAKLNDDQRRTLKTLPALESVAKELEELKKAVETYETEQTNEQALKLIETERAEEQRIAEAIAEARMLHTTRTSSILNFIRLHSLLVSSHPAVSSLNIDEAEIPTLYAAVEHLLGDENPFKQDLISGLLSGEGEFQGVPYNRFLDLAHSFLNLPEGPSSSEGPLEAELSSEQPDVSAASVEGAPPAPGGFHFMQESEIETPAFEDKREWVDMPSGEITSVPAEATATTTETFVLDVGVVEQTVTTTTESSVEVPPSTTGNIDWADDEGGLPSIAGLHAKFGTSESPSPVEASAPQPPVPEVTPAPVNGNRIDEDGFTQARGGRGRGFRGVVSVEAGVVSVEAGVVSVEVSVVVIAEAEASEVATEAVSVVGPAVSGEATVSTVVVVVGVEDADADEAFKKIVVVLLRSTREETTPISGARYANAMQKATFKFIMTSEQQQSKAVAAESCSSPAAVEQPKALSSFLSPQVSSYFIAGGVAGAASRTVVSPLERLKIIQQVQPRTGDAKQYKGVWKSLVRMWQEEGFKGFMRGNGINCVRIIPYSAVQFTTYEQMKKFFTQNGKRELDTPTRLLSGALAGITSVCTTYPLDLIRSRLSIATSSILSPSPSPAPSTTLTSPQPVLASAYHTSSASTALRSEMTMWGMTLKVIREEGGVRALYRGMVATATGVAPYVGINFASYELLRDVITPPGKSSAWRKLACGALAGAVSQSITYPFDVVRRKMQVTGMNAGALGYKYNNAIDATRSIIRTEGLRGMYRGLWPNLLKVAPSIATSFFTYELVLTVAKAAARGYYASGLEPASALQLKDNEIDLTRVTLLAVFFATLYLPMVMHAAKTDGVMECIERTQPMAEASWKTLTADLPAPTHRTLIVAMQVGFVLLSAFFEVGTPSPQTMSQSVERFDWFVRSLGTYCGS
ncbi:hypothetical protein EW146_g10014 [Bondarzewia mesenterica]|uniref:Uncharacterized protein n=1 Tax=Bondarzewia mesenterica TaxID=1095465 RepID=A0A4S4L611_9AGAM|nr:hypothetical protein EW146_g10014 [Bondarzewia mesenterica]